MASGEKNLEGVAPLSRVFAYEWHVKELRDRECVRVASKGLAESHFCAFAQETKSWRDMPPPVFLSKSAQAIENKRWEREKEAQERKRARKPLKTKGVPKWENLGYGLGSVKRRVPIKSCGLNDLRSGPSQHSRYLPAMFITVLEYIILYLFDIVSR